jgi:hypothetical protein
MLLGPRQVKFKISALTDLYPKLDPCGTQDSQKIRKMKCYRNVLYRGFVGHIAEEQTDITGGKSKITKFTKQ